mmetsp:Transcript_87443/g.245458  ORF Transcript_87443/g.245458 Transcript_87443/m.245458 type:complete len:320 (-) Transcript_87443:95-1054(-)
MSGSAISAQSFSLWLATVPDLNDVEIAYAQEVLGSYSVDDTLLDFFASDVGARALQAHRARREAEKIVGAVAAPVDIAADGTPPQKGATADGTAPAPHSRVVGRQKISLSDRRNERHYFPPAAKRGELPKTRRVTGVFKSFNSDKGYGFFQCDSLSKDVYVASSDFSGGEGPLPSDVGRLAEFDLTHDSMGRPQAKNASLAGGSTLLSSCPLYVGSLKSMGEDYGFIECSEVFEQFGRDVYVPRRELNAIDWHLNQRLSFRLTLSAKDQPQAKAVEQEGAELVPFTSAKCVAPTIGTPPAIASNLGNKATVTPALATRW